MTGLADDIELAPERRDPVGEAAQARSRRRIRSADAVVDDLDCRARPVGDHAHAHQGGLAVLARVGERLGDEVVGGGLDGRRQPPRQPDVELDRNGRTDRACLERRLEALAGEERRVQAPALRGAPIRKTETLSFSSILVPPAASVQVASTGATDCVRWSGPITA